VSRKIERLINLTIALLATKRYLTKSEIFRTVEGYEGSAETKERMFERDKDDLRTLGIQIEVGSFDPLFADEAGYRIHSESYQLDLGDISSTEISLLSLAAQAWEGAALADVAQSAILKLNSIGIPADSLDLPGISPKLSNSSEDLKVVTAAISQSDFLVFSYIGSDLSIQIRTVIPFALATKSGFWYISAVDQDVQEIRTFRLDRIQGAIESKENSDVFELPSDLAANPLEAQLPDGYATLDIRKGKGHSLRTLAKSLMDLGEWDQIKVPIFGIDAMTAQILWHGEDVFVQEPQFLRESVIKHLEALVKSHG
jgi:proteasome accessory factor B